MRRCFVRSQAFAVACSIANQDAIEATMVVPPEAYSNLQVADKYGYDYSLQVTREQTGSTIQQFRSLACPRRRCYRGCSNSQSSTSNDELHFSKIVLRLQTILTIDK